MLLMQCPEFDEHENACVAPAVRCEYVVRVCGIAEWRERRISLWNQAMRITRERKESSLETRSSTRFVCDCAARSWGFPLINDLPEEILLYIFSYLPFNDLQSAGAVCSRWNNISQDFTIWKCLSARGLPRINDLPEEILIHIFTYLPISDLHSAGAVCQRWHNIVSDPAIWRSLYSTGVDVSTQVLCDVIRQRRHLKHCTLICRNDCNTVLETICCSCGELTSLALYGCQGVDKVSYNLPIEIDARIMDSLLKRCGKLNELRIGCTDFQSVEFYRDLFQVETQERMKHLYVLAKVRRREMEAIGIKCDAKNVSYNVVISKG